MLDPDGTELVYLGPGPDDRQQVRLRRQGGGDMLATYTTANCRAAWALSVKMAVQMRAGQRETIVIDRPPCDLADQEWLRCRRQLPRFLPPGAELTVITSVGETYTYQGEQRNEA
ncbi:DddA-like double-stranded DNA deaminase toxin [Saccharopolyspora spinosa]|uniref:Nucleic acid/nucleotide deaminase of polymorphic system toxin n=1 Tax=Saccharopolyspora spinosa TaxID=60894 RepID=A0A2N3XVA0_SACSN|nr:DddA-like double-stranded DNA deaminase toxin [Saccharopolyspora spinosa]PKW14603.1 nucleic acid/nucleotide deaminase of polymorphic system toxin [Saccharopolyspora spinosa]